MGTKQTWWLGAKRPSCYHTSKYSCGIFHFGLESCAVKHVILLKKGNVGGPKVPKTFHDLPS